MCCAIDDGGPSSSKLTPCASLQLRVSVVLRSRSLRGVRELYHSQHDRVTAGDIYYIFVALLIFPFSVPVDATQSQGHPPGSSPPYPTTVRVGTFFFNVKILQPFFLSSQLASICAYTHASGRSQRLILLLLMFQPGTLKKVRPTLGSNPRTNSRYLGVFYLPSDNAA